VLLIYVAVWLAVALAIFGLTGSVVLLVVQPQRRVYSRVRQFAATAEAATPAQETQVRKDQRAALFAELDARWASGVKAKDLSLDLSRAEWHLTLTEFALIRAATAFGLTVLLWLLAPRFWWLSLLPALFIGWRLPLAYLHWSVSRRIRRLDSQLADILNILAGAVRSGSSLFQALDRIAREAPEPSKTEYTRVMRAISLGAPLDQALRRLAERVPTEDMEILVTAITIQQQTGGNLAHILDLIATTVRERHRIQREIQVLSAQQRLSAWLLTALPIAMVGLLYLINPDYIGRIFQPGLILIIPITGVLMLILAGFIMNKMASIDV
jgi:tight adherence protein B